MSKVLGIIAEYNPFHNGHLYHLEQSKKQTGSTYTVAIMSGNFTQRGSTSIIDKWSKAQSAIENGIDLVIELPVLYATSSAENFAEGSIKILDSLKVVDYISFGSENNNIDILNKLADILYQEPKEYKNLLSQELKKGLSYPKARENALMIYLNNPKGYKNILSSPNNILGIEYLKALKKYRSNIKPVSIFRYGSNYNDIGYNENIASSTAIRNMIKNNSFEIISKLVPNSSYRILVQNIQSGHVVPDLSVFEKEIIYNLRKMHISEISELPDVSEGLEYAIKNAANSCSNLYDFFNIIKSKRYTQTRIQRTLLYSLLGITKKDIAMSKRTQPYVRILGFNQRGQFLLSKIAKNNPRLQIITSVKKFVDTNSNKNLKSMLDKDIFATNVYTIGYEYDSWSNLDYTKKLIKRD